MAILPEDLLAQAKDLLHRAEGLPDIPEREALVRTSVSRAYYAVYHEALARARRDGYEGAPAGYGSHEGLWDWWFGQQRPTAGLEDGGGHLKNERTRADYRLRDNFSLGRGQDALDDAQAALDLARAGA